jgi:hypothetical protein
MDGLDRLRQTKHQLDPLWTPQHTAHLLGLSPDTLAVWRCTDPTRLPFVKCGRAVRYRREDVIAFIERNRKGGGQ